MSTSKYSTYILKKGSPSYAYRDEGGSPGVWTKPSLLDGWLARRRKNESQPSIEVNYQLDNERFTKNGCFRISEGQVQLERMIELNWVNLRMKRIL